MAGLAGWSLQLEDWKQITTALDGIGWHLTWLDSLFRDSVPDAPGIYMLLADMSVLSDAYFLPNNVSGILYVGRSSSLRDRFRQHASSRSRNPRIQHCSMIFGRLRFAYAMVPATTVLSTDDWISNAEHALITALDPPANRNVPVGYGLVGKLGHAIPAT